VSSYTPPLYPLSFILYPKGMKTIILVILDGWGVGRLDESNPIHTAEPQTMQYIEANFPSCALQAHGMAVGLPWRDPGNREAGYLTLGAGKVLYHNYPKISLAIDDKSFFENQPLKNACAHAREHKSALHLIGLLTKQTKEAHISHVKALVDLANQEGCTNLFLHLFTEQGEGSGNIKTLLQEIQDHLEKTGVGSIATIIGRYYAMDEGKSWDRTEKAYNCLLGNAPVAPSLASAIDNATQQNLNGDLISPTILSTQHPIKDNDSLIFFNFKEDSAQQIAAPFVDNNFKDFPITPLKNIRTTTLTSYFTDKEVPVAFPSNTIETPLSKVFAEQGKTQLKVTESHNKAQLTYFFNGLREHPFENEYHVILPSHNTPRPEDHPEMRATAITDRILTSLNEGGFDLIVASYPNADVMAHTGNISATTQAVRVIDQEMNRLVRSTLERDHILIITADHASAERVINPTTGVAETGNKTNPVPLYLISKELQNPTESQPQGTPQNIGILADVAPTLLELAELSKPAEMTGQSLVSQLKNL